MQKKRPLCLCCSGKPYANCCHKYHQGQVPENPIVLMRSRYSAYALSIEKYIIETTHPNSPYFLSDKNQWLHQIRNFSQQVTFEKLEILDQEIFESEAFVIFVAYLNKGRSDLTFTEKSRFVKDGQTWKYMDGKIAKGSLTKEQINNLSS